MFVLIFSFIFALAINILPRPHYLPSSCGLGQIWVSLQDMDGFGANMNEHMKTPIG